MLRRGPITGASLPRTALDAFSPLVKLSLGRGNLWGAQGSIIYGPPLARVGVRWLWLNLIRCKPDTSLEWAWNPGH